LDRQPPRITLITLTVSLDTATGAAGIAITSPQSGRLDLADLYGAVEAARQRVMQMEQQAILRQAQEQQAGLRKAQPAQSGAAGQLAEAVMSPASMVSPN